MYQHMMVAIDLTDESDQVLDKALSLYRLAPTKISLVHVIEPISYAYGGDIPLDLGDIQQQLEERSSERLQGIIAEQNIENAEYAVLIGRAENEIHRYAEDNKVDLVIVGSHGRHGLQLLLGSTANAILHGAKCDVLAVRMKDRN